MFSLQKFVVVALIWPLLSAVDTSKASLTLCCNVDEVSTNGKCEKSSETSDEYPGIIRSNETNEVMRICTDACGYRWILEDYEVFENGSIWSEELSGNGISDFGHYCLFRNPNSANYSAKACRLWCGNVYWDSFCLIVAIIVLFAIFIGYSIVPELRNLHGRMLRSYLASYILTCAWGLVAVITAETEDQTHLFVVSYSLTDYCGISCIFWLNVISFDIWRTVRCLRCFDYYGQIRRRKRYIWYAVYAWIIPAVLIPSYVAVMHYSPILQNVIVRQMIRRYCRLGVKSSVFICNTFFYVSTLVIIKRHKKDTVNLIDGINRHYEVEKQRINLHVKLYVMMGGNMIPWICRDIWPTPLATSIFTTVETMQSILIFFTFLWKDNIKVAMRRRFSGVALPRQSTVSTIS